MNKAWDKLKKTWEENPQQVIALACFAALATAKLLDATTKARNAHTWKQEVNRRSLKGF